MFKRKKASITARVLPLRNATISLNNSTASLNIPTHVWFTPEQIIFDAFNLLVDVVWLWKSFKTLLPIFVLRLAALLFLAFVLLSPKIGIAVLAESVEPTILAENNAIVQSTKPNIEINTKIVAEEKVVKKTPSVASASAASPFKKIEVDGSKRWPVPLSYISTYFSGYHQGIDIPAKYGNPVYPFQAGTVIFSGWDGGFGKLVVVKHGNDLITKYAHLSTISVAKGANVGVNTIVGQVGTTGYATGPHLHFETHGSGGSVNPLSLLP